MRMKKHFILLLVSTFLTLVSVKTYAQSFNAGLIAGATISKVDGDKYYGYHKLGLTAGTYVNLPVSEHFALQMELKYTQMGAHSSSVEVVEYGYPPYNLRLHYAEIPLMLRYDFGHFTVYGNSLNFLNLEAGLSLDFLLKHHGEVDDGNAEWRFNFFSVTGNLGAHFSITDHFGIGVRWMYSFLPMQTNPTPQRLFDHSWNKVIQGTLTYSLYSPLR